MVNTVDISGIDKVRLAPQLGQHSVPSSASDAIEVAVVSAGSSGDAIYQLIIPAGADAGTFKLNYQDNVVTTATMTTAISIGTTPSETADHIKSAWK